MVAGIYMISTDQSKKVYIGSTKDFEGRWGGHVYSLQRQRHGNRHLQNAWNKYGEKSFFFDVLEETTIEELTQREQFYIDTYRKKAGALYNLAPIAGNNSGVKWGEASREKARARKHPENVRKKMSENKKKLLAENLEIREKYLAAFAKARACINHETRIARVRQAAKEGRMSHKLTPERRQQQLANMTSPAAIAKMAQTKRKPVLCVSNGRVYACADAAAIALGIGVGQIYKVCAGAHKTAGKAKLIFKYVKENSSE